VILDYKEFTKLVENFAGELPELLASHHKTRDIAPQIQRLLKFAETRFTLAVVGQMRAGKSSLLNSLIGADLAMVGVNETTATVNWFTYATGEQTRRFRVHWKGRPPEDRDLAERDQWIGESALARDARKLEFFADTEFLKTADVVDTPGTRSLIVEHQEAVDEFLAQKADNETRQIGGGADAILYVVPPVARESDSELLEQFKQTTRLPNSPPHNSLAVVHKWETLESDDPHAEAQRKAARIYEAMRDFVSGTMPVSAPLGWAGERFPDAFWTRILDLAFNTGPDDFNSMLKRDTNFERDYATCPFDGAGRMQFRSDYQIPWPSLKFILRSARSGSSTNAKDLRTFILKTSGIPDLRQEICRRFFARAGALKMSKLLATAFEPCQRAEHILRNHKLELHQDLQKAEYSETALSERIHRGDSALVPAQQFILSAVRNGKDDLAHVSENLRRISLAALLVKEKQQQVEGDMEMLGILDSSHELPSELLEMLRCLFGRYGGDTVARLSFLPKANRNNVDLDDLDRAISKLQEFRRSMPLDMKRAVDHGINRLEEIANAMDEDRILQSPTRHDGDGNDAIIAIDFGMDHTKAAYYEDCSSNARIVVLGEQQSKLIPSVFYLPKAGGKILIGSNAVQMGKVDPDGVIVGLKGEIHKTGKIRRGFGREMPERIILASKLFEYIRCRYLAQISGVDSISRCALAVPSGFHEPQREAIKQAAHLAGFSDVTFVDSGIAAARAWLAESGEAVVGSLLVANIGYTLAEFSTVYFANDEFHVSDIVLPSTLDAGSTGFENRIADRILHLSETITKANQQPPEILLIGEGSRRDSLTSTIKALNIGLVHLPKEAEFAVAMGAATPLRLVLLRHRLFADLKEIERAEQELLDLDCVLGRLSPQRAADWNEAAILGWPEGKWLAGACHFEGINGWPHNKEIGARCFQQALEAGFRKAYSSLATCYDQGEGVTKNPVKAVELWNAAAVSGDPFAAIALANHYLEGQGVPADPARSMSFLRGSADSGSAFARWLLGVRYLQGTGCECDEKEAQRQFRLAVTPIEKSARNGGKTAQWVIGCCYLRAWGVQTNLPLAIEWLSKSAEQGYTWAQTTLADCYVDGVGVPVDARKAVELLRGAAIQGAATAQAKLGITLLSGFGGTVDAAEAFEWFRKSADHGDADGQHQLGRCFVYAIGVHENKVVGFGWIKKAAEQGHALAQNDVGQCLLNGIGVIRDPQAAIPWLKKSAEQNCPVGLCSIALCYRAGVGIARDQQQAVALFRQSAEMGHHDSMMWLGVSLRDDNRTPSDKCEAVSWLRRAAENNHSGAIFQLGLCLVHGVGVGKDVDTGFSHVQRAAEMGDSDAQCFVGNCWLAGDYVRQNYYEAFKWLSQAAEQGNFDGQIGLGKCYLNGWGITRDVSTAAKWLQPAADAGYPDAKTLLGKCYQTGLL
jgi:TPR repeat protein